MFKAFAAVLLISLGASAKNLENRLGASIGNSMNTDTPLIGAIYYPGHDYAVLAGVGIDTKKDNSNFELNAGVRRIVFKEDNMNFFFSGRLGLLTSEVATKKQSGFSLSATFGGEFFLQGLDSLGFSFEGGFGVDSTDAVRFRTVGLAPLRGFVTFYF